MDRYMKDSDFRMPHVEPLPGRFLGTPKPESRKPNPVPESRFPNPDSRIPNPGFRIPRKPNPETQIQVGGGGDSDFKMPHVEPLPGLFLGIAAGVSLWVLSHRVLGEDKRLAGQVPNINHEPQTINHDE